MRWVRRGRDDHRRIRRSAADVEHHVISNLDAPLLRKRRQLRKRLVAFANRRVEHQQQAAAAVQKLLQRIDLDIEKGDYFRALGRYNGSLGKPEYPNLVLAAWRGRWKYDGPTA